MKRLAIYQFDAFSSHIFGGNPAAIVPLDKWLEDAVMQSIAEENNLSETAFFVEEGKNYRLRWFTPTIEVNLCGHATLAAAHLIFSEIDTAAEKVSFETHSGMLTVRREGNGLAMKFPSLPHESCELTDQLKHGLGVTFAQVYGDMDYMVVLDSEEAVRVIQPNFSLLAKVDRRGVIVTATGNDCDFVCRFFAPAAGINEDPVTGSAYSMLAPYWAKRLGKTEMYARQLSRRGGEVKCRLDGDRVIISGQAQLYLKGEITLPCH